MVDITQTSLAYSDNPGCFLCLNVSKIYIVSKSCAISLSSDSYNDMAKCIAIINNNNNNK